MEKTADKRTSKTPDVKNSMKKNLNKESSREELFSSKESEKPTVQAPKNPFNILAAKRDERKNEILLKNQNPIFNSRVKVPDVIMEDDIASSDTENKELNELMSKMNIDNQASPSNNKLTSHFKINSIGEGDVEMVDEFDVEDDPKASESNDGDWEDIKKNSQKTVEDKENIETNKLLNDCIKRLTEVGEALLSKEKAKSGRSDHPHLKSSMRGNTSLHDHLDTHKKSVTIITPNRAGVLQDMDIEQYQEYYEKSSRKVFDPNEWNIGRFEIGMPLSRGKFGHVLLVRERVSKYLFVLKMMFKSQLKKNPKYLRNFRREIEIHSKLNHENIVKMHGWFSDEKKLYIILEYCPEGELFSILQSQKNL